MNPSHKQSRVPLLSFLRKVFLLSDEAATTGRPVEELLEASNANGLHRRRFISDIAKAGMAISAAGLLNGCLKTTDLFAEEPPVQDKTDFKSDQLRILILGAGMAGLNCAYQLKKRGYESTVYEASKRVGGRIFSEQNVVSPSHITELGGEFIDTEHKDMLKLCREFNLPLLDTLSGAESALLRDTYFIDGRHYSEAEVLAAFEPYQKRIAADIRSLPNSISFEQHDPQASYFDNLSIKAYLDKVGMGGFLRKGIEVAYLTEYGLETEEQSAINFLYLFSANTSHGFEIYGSSDERYKIAGGNQRLTNALYNQVKSQVQVDYTLVRIKEKVQGYSLTFDTGNRSETVYADIIVCTIPFSVLRDIDLQVSLPPWKRNAINNLGYGTNSKLFLGFSRPVWRSYYHTGYIFSNLDLQTGWDHTQLQTGNGAGYTVFQGGIKGLALGSGTLQSQAPKFVSQLEQMWPGCASAYTGRVNRMHWPEYPFSKGSYGCYKVGQYTTIHGAEKKPVDNLFFAGEHCSDDFQGYMNGAAETGRIAAEDVIKAVKGVRKEVIT